MRTKIKLTKTSVDGLPFAETGKQVDHFDTELPAFGVRVSSTSKTYFIRARIKGKMTRVNLGRHGVITADTARKEAKDAFTALRRGVDLNLEKAKSRQRGITLQEVYDQYVMARPDMTERTRSVDRSLLHCHVSDWLRKPVRDITEDAVKRRHLKIARDSGRNTANNVMRLLRRLHRFANRTLKEPLERDLVRDALEGQWYRETRRQTHLKRHELPIWYQALQKVANPIIRDYLELLLFTGIREREGMTLRWDHVDMEDETFRIVNPKNHSPLLLPMSDVLKALFQRRLSLRENEFVFPGTGKTGHLMEVKRQIDFIERETQKLLNGAETDEELEKLATELPADGVKPGIRFCLHDLRRTFASIAEGEVSYSVLKRLLNHKDKDVTQGYIILTAEKLRAPMQQVTNAILRLLEEKRDTKVITAHPGWKG